ncbi:MAG: NADH-quinone oxidoreductase subunit L [Phycisphaeraceae bacterium]
MTPTQLLIRNLLVTATLAPLVSSLIVLFIGKRVMGRSAGWFATAVMAGAFACSLAALTLWIGDTPGTIVWNIPWIPWDAAADQWLYLGCLIDSLTIAMMAMVTGIAFLVHLYSIGYMKGDPLFERFFAYMSLFSFSMLGIVMANSIIMLFVFWELVGLTSYLLIGFWFHKRGPQLACKKAFVMNRIGDAGFLIGFGILFYQLGGGLLLPAAMEAAGTTSGATAAIFTPSTGNMFAGVLDVVAEQGYSVTHPPLWLTLAGIGLFFGAIGKSAQFPLHTWLPDAMEGPTPVSSIVHSATMVAAGVYLTARIYPILTPTAHLFVATIGLITLVMAACMAMVMTDIKRVLAYSTLSQLGYMILGLGAGAYAYALFHLITHAFFKCCLFQCSGSVIHAAHHQQDMRYYGGLWRKMPVTAACYLICTFAIAGASIPFSDIGISGFYSKDGIIAGTVGYGSALAAAGYWAGPLFYWAPLIVAYMTVFYMARSFTLTFLGKPRDQHLYDHAHEAPATMVIPQVCLAVMAVLTVPVLLPFFDLIKATEPMMAVAGPAELVPWLQPTAAIEGHSPGMALTHLVLLSGFAWIIMLSLGIAMYLPGMKHSSRIVRLPGINLLYTWALNKFYFDALYDVFTVNAAKAFFYVIGWIDRYLVDGLVNLVGYVGKGTAWMVGRFDDGVIDGAVNGAAVVAQNSGNLLRQTQVGRIRQYVLLLFASAALVMLVVVTVALTR